MLLTTGRTIAFGVILTITSVVGGGLPSGGAIFMTYMYPLYTLIIRHTVCQTYVCIILERTSYKL